jgi:protein involved in polysaccharide export with SLBB domain
MRSIQLKRNNQVVTEFDLYDLLMNGDKSKDVALLPGDVIYVPPIGPLVAVAGSVNVPAIYELKGKTTLGDGLRFAGLLTVAAEGQKVTVERIDNRSVRKVEEFPLDEGGLARPLQDGDLVSILALSPRFENAVTLRGNVARPGRYPWRPGMRVSDLIPNREMLITRRYWINQNLAPEGEAGQLSREAALEGIVPNPEHPDVVINESLTPSRIPTDKEKKDKAGSNKTDRSKTGQTIADKRDTEESVGETLIRTDVKRNAPEVNWDYAVVQRLNQEDLTTRLLPFNLGKAVLDHEETNNLLLEAGDIVTVFSHADLQVPLAKQSKFIQLEGEFKAAGVYQAQPGDTLRDLVERAGGLTQNAYLFGAQFTRESTRIEQQKRLDAFLDQMDQEIERSASTASTRAQGTPEEGKVLEARAEAQRKLVLRLRQVKATGRVVLEMKAKDPTLADLPNLSLEDGDRLVIPARPAIVNVIGAVYNENAHLYRPGRRVSDYVRAAGGTTRHSDSGRMFVIRADGSVVGRASTSHLWGDSFDSLRLMPGDAIVVPERLERSNLGRDLRDWVQVFAQVALSAAVFRSVTK